MKQYTTLYRQGKKVLAEKDSAPVIKIHRRTTHTEIEVPFDISSIIQVNLPFTGSLLSLALMNLKAEFSSSTM